MQGQGAALREADKDDSAGRSSGPDFGVDEVVHETRGVPDAVHVLDGCPVDAFDVEPSGHLGTVVDGHRYHVGGGTDDFDVRLVDGR